MQSASQTVQINKDCSHCPIRHRAVCARCDADELELLESMKYYREFDAGQTIVWSGDELNFVASVVDGIASLSQTMEDGRRQMVGLLLPSDFLGRPGRTAAPYDVTASTNVTLCCFRRGPFEQLMNTTPHVAQRLLEMTLDELDAAREWLLLLGRKTAREKIASLLAIIARRKAAIAQHDHESDFTFDLPMTREAMADYLGLTLETVSRQVSALKRDGVIKLQGKREVTIPDFSRLLDETGDDSDGGFLV
ncbi:MAG: Crp/Fnr family transcriptional regulator [Pseudomonadota bacterium]